MILEEFEKQLLKKKNFRKIYKTKNDFKIAV